MRYHWNAFAALAALCLDIPNARRLAPGLDRRGAAGYNPVYWALRGRAGFLPLLAALCVWNASASRANAAEPKPALTLSEAEHLVVRVNPKVLKARALQQALRHQSVAIAQLPDPELGLMAQNVPVDSLSLAQGQNAMLSVGLSQHFPPYGQRQAKGQAVQAESRAAFYGTLATQAQALLALRTAWIDAAYDRRAVRAFRAQQQLAMESVRAARARLRANDGTESDVLRAQLDEQALQNKITNAQALHVAAVATIAELLATPEPPSLAGGWPKLPAPASLAALEGRLVGNPALRALDRKRSAAAAKVRVARSAYHPSITVSGSYGRTYYPGMPNQVTIGVDVSLPLFTTNRQDQTLEAAQARDAAAREDYIGQVLHLTQSTRAQFARYLAARARWQRTQRALLPTARAAFSATLGSYTAGSLSMREVLKAQRAVLRYALDALKLHRDLSVAEANLAYLGTRAERQP